MARYVTPKDRGYNLFAKGTPSLGDVVEGLMQQEKTALHWAGLQVIEKCEKPYTVEDWAKSQTETEGELKKIRRPASCYDYARYGYRNAFEGQSIEYCEVCQLGVRIMRKEEREKED